VPRTSLKRNHHSAETYGEGLQNIEVMVAGGATVLLEARGGTNTLRHTDMATLTPDPNN
jgi:hypothetical protein